MSIWWRRGESNSCPKTYSHRHLRVQFVLNIPLSSRRQTGERTWYPPIHHPRGRHLAVTFTTHRRPIQVRGPTWLDGCLIKQQRQRYCCRLILKCQVFKRSCTSTRFLCFKIPVETITPPCFNDFFPSVPAQHPALRPFSPNPPACHNAFFPGKGPPGPSRGSP